MIAMGIVLFFTLATWFTYNPHHPYWSLISGILLAPGNTGVWLLIPSMNADVVDYDELQTNDRREGAFASIYSWVVKLSATIGAGLCGPLIVLAGFHVESKLKVLPPDVLTNMRLLYAFLPGLFLGPAILLLSRYSLSPKTMLDIRAQLEARRGKV